MNPDLQLTVTTKLLTQNGTDRANSFLGDNLGSTIEVLATSAAAIALLALVPLIIMKAKKGDQTIEDSEAAVRHFLP